MASSILTRAAVPSFPGLVIIDEIHNFRNPETKGWRGANKVVRDAPFRVGLSATPINNALSDLSAELALLLKQPFFVMEAVLAEVWRDESRHILYPLMTRFAKDKLGIHFAKRQISDTIVEFPSTYTNEVRRIVKGLRNRGESDTILRDEITYFRLAASSPSAFEDSVGVVVSKPLDKIRELREILRRHKNEHLIVFCAFERTSEEIAAEVTGRESFTITGSVPVFAREDRLKAFRNSKNGVLVMTSVGSEGLDLQFCSTLVNYDLTWNPMVLEQRIGRIDRIGQRKDQIKIYNFIVAGSIDERIMQTLGRKLGLVNGTLLETSSVVSGAESGPIYHEEDVAEETAEAEELARAMTLSASIIPDDYAVIPAVAASYCDPKQIARSGGQGLPWIEKNDVGGQWRQNLDKRAADLKKVIDYYA